MTNFVSMTDLMRSHVDPYMRLFWFLNEAVEREHRLNFEALSGTPAAFVHAWTWIVTSGMPPARSRWRPSSVQPPLPLPLKVGSGKPKPPSADMKWCVRSVSRPGGPCGLPRDARLHSGLSASAQSPSRPEKRGRFHL